MLVVLNQTEFKNQLEAFCPQLLLKTQDIILNPVNTQNCLDIMSNTNVRIGQLVSSIFETGSYIGYYGLKFGYSGLIHFVFGNFRTPLFFEACETVNDFWGNPHNRSLFEKINAIISGLYVGSQTAEGFVRVFDLWTVSAPGRESIVMVTCTLSIISFASNTVIKKIGNSEELSGALFEITKKTFESINIIILLEPEYFANYYNITTVNNVYLTAKNVYSTAVISIFPAIINFSNWMSAYLNPVYGLEHF
ncbi:MAG: hypothetical protein H0U27_08610 [Nitrosopumilus sp.]|nr:hypothetical protein [Nitrosopumilus sp.]